MVIHYKRKLTMNLKPSENFYNYLVQILVQKVIQHQKKARHNRLFLV